MIKECLKHGETTFALMGSGTYKRYRCKKCRTEAVTKRRRKVKIDLVNHFGAKCIICGYDTCRSALSFHHVDPTVKEFGIAHRGVTISYKRALAEAEKCILVCMNCHAEIHSGLHSSLIERLMRENTPKSGNADNANPELAETETFRASVETLQSASLVDEEKVQTTNII